MANVIVPLIDGFKVGETVHREAELRAPTAGDILDATLEAERAVLTPAGYQLLVSPTLVSVHVLRRQVIRIGNHPGPLSHAEIKLLSEIDLRLLQTEAEALDAAVQGALQTRGRPAGPGASNSGR